MMISSCLINALSCCGPHMASLFETGAAVMPACTIGMRSKKNRQRITLLLVTSSGHRAPIAGSCKARPRQWLAHVITNHRQEPFAFQSQFPLGLDGLVP